MTAISVDDFPKYPRYTTTYIAVVNWKIDYVSLFQHLKFPKLQKDPLDGMKRAEVKLDVKSGSVLQVKYKDAYKIVHIRGFGQKGNKKVGCFSNSATIVMYINKIIVIKVPSNGKIHITGCRTEEQVYSAVHAIWRHIKKIRKKHPEVALIPEGEVPRVIYFASMNNISMNLGFNVNKRRIHEFLYKDTEFSIIPNDKKYAGVTAKLEVEGLQELPLVRHRFLNGRWYKSMANWNDYLAMLSAKDRQKEKKTERYHTFLIFHSGKVIQSGPRYALMEDVFRYFIGLITEHRGFIEDKTTEVANKRGSKKSA